MPNGIEAKSAAKVKGDGKPKNDKAKVPAGDSVFTKLSRFGRESYIEVVKKAAWPTWPELKKFTTVVIVAVIIIAVWIGGLDYILGKLTDPLLQAGARAGGVPR